MHTRTQNNTIRETRRVSPLQLVVVVVVVVTPTAASKPNLVAARDLGLSRDGLISPFP